MPDSFFYLISLIILLLFSGFFSGCETAYTSMSIIRMKNMAKKSKVAKLALKLRENYSRLITTILIGNNLVNIIGTTIATILFTQYYTNIGVTLGTMIVTISILIFGEIFPKTISQSLAEKISLLFAYPLFIIYILLFPFSILFDVIGKGLKKVFRFKDQPTMTEEEFEILVDEIHEEGILNGIEKNLILNTIEYGDLLISDVMTKAKDIIYVKDSDSLEKIQEVFETYNYSRIPIAKTNKISSIYGLIYQKEFYEMLLNDELDLKSIIVEPMFTKPGIKISRQLKTFQREKQHMALVKSKSGKIVGVVTMEDILEELVGEIEDEYYEEREEVEKELEELNQKEDLLQEEKERLATIETEIKDIKNVKKSKILEIKKEVKEIEKNHSNNERME